MSAALNEDRTLVAAIITVHGTDDARFGDEGRTKWWQIDSSFSQRLCTLLHGMGLAADIIPHRWTGANSDADRERAAETLAARISLNSGQYHSIHVVGHSHGGTIAVRAAELLGWPKPQAAPLSVTAVGTPHFRDRLGWRERLSARAFLLLTFTSAIAICSVTLWSLVMRVMNDEGEAWLGDGARILLLLAISLLVFRLVFPSVLRAARRSQRYDCANTGNRQVHCVYHPEDEVIALLQRVDRMALDPVKRGSLYRGFKPAVMAISASLTVLGAGVSLLYGTACLVIGAFGADLMESHPALVHLVAPPDAAAVLIWVALYAALVAFGLLYSMALSGAAIVDWLFAGWLSRLVASRIRGMAFGADSAQPLGDVQTQPHGLPGRLITISGPFAAAMSDSAREATDGFLKQWRSKLCLVDVFDETMINNVKADARTWRSLIHTTYFDHAAMADLCADIIGSSDRGAKPETAADNKEHPSAYSGAA